MHEIDTIKMKNIVITGANGFVGSHVLESFNENTTEDYAVIAACRTASKLPSWYTKETSIGDLADFNYVDSLTTKADVICHTAAWAEMNGTNEDSKKYFYNPTINLINSALKNKVKRFIFLSAITSKPIVQKEIHSNKRLDNIWAHYDSILKIEEYLERKKGQGMEILILRVGFFTGKNYSLGLLPILLPRLKTHLVPWIAKGNTTLPLINGKDIGTAFRLSSLVKLKNNFEIIDVVGREIPTVRDVFTYLNTAYKYPLPHYSVSFKMAYGVAFFMRFIYRIIHKDPLLVPAIVLLLEETRANNRKAKKILNYQPSIHWKDSIDEQLSEMKRIQKSNMKMNK